MSTRNSSRFTPIIIAISVVAGILIGTFYAKHFAGNRLGIINGSSNKLNALLRIVDDQYVDTVNMTDLVEKAMPQILAELLSEDYEVTVVYLKEIFQKVSLRSDKDELPDSRKVGVIPYRDKNKVAFFLQKWLFTS